jgi:hypothetical protein
MVFTAETPLRFLAACRRGPGEYVEADEHEPTMEALRWAAEISSLLSGEQVEPVPFIDKCRRPGGTFAMTMTDPAASRAASYYAARVLTLTGRPDDIPDELPHWFAAELAAPGRPASSDIDEMFYVLRALQQVDALSLLSTDVIRSLVDFIARCADPSGGYAGIPGQPPDIEHTYCAVCSLSLLGRPLKDAERRTTAAWLSGRFATPSGLAALTATDDTPSIAATYWGFRAGEVLGATVWTDRLREAVENHRKTEGGYGTRTYATLWESYCALRVISKLSDLRGGTE